MTPKSPPKRRSAQKRHGKPCPKEVADLEDQIRNLPRSAGVFLIASGTVGGLVVPGLPGALIALLGAMILVPKQKSLAKLDHFLKNSAPEVRLEAYRFVTRFFRDLDRRFPKQTRRSSL